MQLNVLNDLAEAMKALDVKKDVKGYTFDIVHCAHQIYTGTAASDSQALLDRPRKWAQWVFSLEELWQDDAPMQDRSLMVHCS